MQKKSHQTKTTHLYRSETHKMIAGVAGGLGEYFNIDPNIIRILFIVFSLFHGVGLLVYIIMWIIIPSQLSESGENTVQENMEEIKTKAQSFAHTLSFRNGYNTENSRFWWAILIIILGFFFLFRNFGIFDGFDLGKFWPVILIITGLVFFLRR